MLELGTEPKKEAGDGPIAILTGIVSDSLGNGRPDVVVQAIAYNDAPNYEGYVGITSMATTNDLGHFQIQILENIIEDYDVLTFEVDGRRTIIGLIKNRDMVVLRY